MSAGTVYQLEVAGRPAGLFLSPEGARARAQEMLDGYWQLHDEASDEENESYEALTTRTLSWADEQHYIGRGRSLPVGAPLPTARFSEAGFFVVRRREVAP